MPLALLGGGIVGAVLSLAVLDFALIFLSSVAGVKLIVQTIHFNPPMGFALFAVLFGMGVGIQVRMLRK